MCLAFPKTGCSLGVNQRDTHRSEQPCYSCMSVYMGFSNLCMCAHLYLCGNKVRFVTVPFAMGCNICHAKFVKLISYGLINHATSVPCGTGSSDTKCGQHFTVKQRLCVSFSCGMEGSPMGLLRTPPVTLCSPSSVTC